MSGLHHVSSIGTDPQRMVDFYEGVLGMRLVKRTVNFDDPGTWHLYFGDTVGSPGTLVTLFAWSVPPLATARGRAGPGQVVTISLSVLDLDFWTDRLAGTVTDFDGPLDDDGPPRIVVRDPDGIELELVSVAGDVATSSAVVPDVRGRSGVPEEHAIGGLHAVALSLLAYDATATLLTTHLGFEVERDGGDRLWLRAGESRVELRAEPLAKPGAMGTGAVHHVAFRARDREAQASLREELIAAGYAVTPVLDRKYFESFYFKEPGGVIFEVATDGPGFLVDESAEMLGSSLMLPSWLEPRRERIEAKLPVIRS